MTTRPELVSVVVPVYCEETNIRPFYEEIQRVTADVTFDLELLFVDDGSTDQTLAKLTALAAEDSRVRVLQFSRNFGSYAAIMAGLRHCRGDAAVCISVDLQDPPGLLVDLVRKWREGHDIVWAVRSSRDDPLFKTSFAQLFYWALRKTTFKDLPPGGMDVALFSRRVVDIYLEIPERHSIPFFTIFAFGFKQASIPYHRERRVRGKSSWTFWKRVQAALNVFVSFSYAPIRFISVIGLLTAFAAFVLTLYIVLQKLLFDVGSSGWPSLIALILATSGVQMLVLGVVAEYLWRQSEYIRQRPRYIVMNEFGARVSADESTPRRCSECGSPLGDAR